MHDDLRQIPGIGDATIDKVTDRFPSQSALDDASLTDLQDVPNITAARAIQIKANICPTPAPIAAVDDTAPRLTERFDVDGGAVQQVTAALSDRQTGRDSDVANLVRASLAVHQLPVKTYRDAFRAHGQQIADEFPESPDNFRVTGDDGEPDELVAGWMERQRDRQLLKRRSRKMDDVGAFIAVFLDVTGPFGTKLDAIIAVNVIFDPVTPRSLPGYVVADPVGCSSGYATEFEPVQVAGRTVVLRKEYAARRQVEKAETWQRNAVLRRDDEACVRCGDADDLVVHHITPIDAGGSDDLENMATLCRTCHHDAHGGVASTSEVVYASGAFWDWVNNVSNQ